jgi:4-diphosphocytidyl-2-C-methyl-D-erythritol kinase
MDVPFFLLGGAAWAHGYGEQLEPLATVWAGRPLVLAYPGFSLSTAAVYAAYDQLAPTMRPDATRWALLRQGLLSGSVDPKWLDNSLEDAAWRVSPALRSFAEHVRQLAKPYPCFLSGSGSAYYIIGFDEDDHWALWLAERLKRHGVAWAQATQFLGPNGSGGKDDRDCMPLF